MPRPDVETVFWNMVLSVVRERTRVCSLIQEVDHDASGPDTHFTERMPARRAMPQGIDYIVRLYGRDATGFPILPADEAKLRIAHALLGSSQSPSPLPTGADPDPVASGTESIGPKPAPDDSTIRYSMMELD